MPGRCQCRVANTSITLQLSPERASQWLSKLSPHLPLLPPSFPPPSRPGSSRVWWLGGENRCFWRVEGEVCNKLRRVGPGQRRGAKARRGAACPAAARIAHPACCLSVPSVAHPPPERTRLIPSIHSTLLPRLQICCANRVCCVCVPWARARVCVCGFSTIGAGDTFVAGMLYALHADAWSRGEKLAFAVGLATKKVQREGFAGLAHVP